MEVEFMKRALLLLALVAAVSLSAAPIWGDDGFFVIAGGGKVGTQINSVPYTINSPGLYCLARNISYSTTTGHAITVAASDVTLDLNGFCLMGPGKFSGTNYGIYIQDGISNVEIRNGTIRNFGGDGVHGLTTSKYFGIRVLSLRVIDTGNVGIYLEGGGNNLVAGCSVMGADFGIYTYSYSTVSGNMVKGNPALGIATLDYCTISGNTVEGLVIGSYCTLVNNTVYSRLP